MKKTIVIGTWSTALSLTAGAWAGAGVVWEEDFDGYVAGLPIIPQQPCFPSCPPGLSWQAWDNIPGVGLSEVSDAQSHSGANSLAIIGGDGSGGQGADDLVHTYNDLALTAGVYAYRTYQYVPSDAAGGSSWFNLMNTYPASANPHWSVATTFNAGSGIVQSWDGEQLPLIKGEWVEFRVVINLDLDQQEIFYGGQLLTSKSWTGGVAEGGAVNIAAVDLYGGDAPWTAYYDDIVLEELEPFGACCRRDGTCTEGIDQTECEALGGDAVFQGIGSSCIASDCPTFVAGRGWLRDAPFEWTGNTCTDFPGVSECNLRASNDNLWEITIPWAQTWSFSVCGTAEFDTFMYFDRDAQCTAMFDASNDDAPGCGVTSEINVFLDPGAGPADATVYVALEGLNQGNCGAYTFTATAPCPPLEQSKGCIQETGGPCANEDTDQFNIGCNGPVADPPQDDTFEDMECGETRCGTVGNFTFQGGGRRDLDWYRIFVDEIDTTVTMTAVGEFPQVVIFLAELSPVGDCGDCSSGTCEFGTLVATGGTNQCTQVAEYSTVVGPGFYSPIITTAFDDPANVPCGSKYEFTLTCTTCVISGDTDGNGCVEFADILVILANWGGPGPLGDADCNGVVEFADILLVLSTWGVGCP